MVCPVVVEAQDEVAVGVDGDALCTFEVEADRAGIRAGLDDEVVLELPLVPVVAQVDAVVDLVVSHGCVVGHVATPLILAAHQVVALRLQQVLAAGGRIVVGAAQVEAHGIATGFVLQTDDRVAVGQPHGVAVAAGEEIDVRVALPGVDLERERAAHYDGLGSSGVRSGKIQQAGKLALRQPCPRPHAVSTSPSSNSRSQSPPSCWAPVGSALAATSAPVRRASASSSERPSRGTGHVATVDQQVAPAR